MKLLFSVALLAIVATTSVPADPRDDQRGPHKHGQTQQTQAQIRISYFPPQDVRVIREYYGPRTRSLPPGLAKKYERTGQLPPGWQKKIEPLPVAVERRLVALPPEYRRGYVDGVVVVYSPRTQVVVDIAAVLGAD
jgi:hypothetical protein